MKETGLQIPEFSSPRNKVVDTCTLIRIRIRLLILMDNRQFFI